MKKSILFSLCAVAPFLLNSEEFKFEELFTEDELLSIEENTDAEVPQSLAQDEKMFSDKQPNPSSHHTMSSQQQKDMMNRDCWPPMDKHWIVGAQFLWWKVDEKYLDYTTYNPSKPYTTDPITRGRLESEFLGKLRSVDLEWNPGVRVNVGYEFKDTPWIVKAEYTGYETSGESSIDRRGLGAVGLASHPLILSSRFPFLSFLTAFAKSSVHFHYNIANFTFERSI